MMLEKHLERTGGKGKEVHEFIDQFNAIYGEFHRPIFHHKKAIEWIVKIFGPEAKGIAEKHIHDDLYGDMFDGPLPEDQFDGRFFK